MIERAAVIAIAAAACGTESGSDRAADRELTPEPMLVKQYQIAADGDHFVIVWTALGAADYVEKFWAIRVTATGEIATPAVVVAEQDRDTAGIRLLAGSPMILVDREQRGGSVRARTLDPASLALGAGVDLDSLSGCNGNELGATRTAAGIALLYCTPDLTARAFGEDLAPTTARGPIVVGGTANQPHLMTLPDGQLYGVWRENDRIYGARIDPASATLATLAVQLHDTGNMQTRPNGIALEDGSVLVSWADGNDQHRVVLALDSDGSPRWAAPRALVPDNRQETLDVAFATRADRVRMFWQDTAIAALPTIRSGVLVGEEIIENEPISDGVAPAGDPVAAAGRDVFGVVYAMYGYGRRGLRFAAVP